EKVALPLTPETVHEFIKPVSQNQFAEKTVVSSAPAYVTPVATAKDVAQPVAAPQTDLFNPIKPTNTTSNVVSQQDANVVRHTLDVQEEFTASEQVEDNGGYELKTSPSVFEFKMPTVFDSYQEEVNEQIEEEVNNIV